MYRVTIHGGISSNNKKESGAYKLLMPLTRKRPPLLLPRLKPLHTTLACSAPDPTALHLTCVIGSLYISVSHSYRTTPHSCIAIKVHSVYLISMLQLDGKLVK